MARPQKFDYFCVLDFEATCEQDVKLKPMEVVEFPIVLMNASTLQTEADFHHYVRPVVHPKLTPFCTELTGISCGVAERRRRAAVLSQLDRLSPQQSRSALCVFDFTMAFKKYRFIKGLS